MQDHFMFAMAIMWYMYVYCTSLALIDFELLPLAAVSHLADLVAACGSPAVLTVLCLDREWRKELARVLKQEEPRILDSC